MSAAEARPRGEAVWQRREDGRLVPHAVERGLSDGCFVELRSGAVSPGDRAVIRVRER